MNFELEKEELALIYDKDYTIKSSNEIEIKINLNAKHATLTFLVPDGYPKEIPKVHAELEGISGEPLEKFLENAANTMLGLSMISYLVGEATDYLNGSIDNEVVEQQEHITQTPFSREAFLLWLDKFKKEIAEKESSQKKPMTGKEWFKIHGSHLDTQ